MGAILLVEWPATDPARRRETAGRLSALALRDAERLLFTAGDPFGDEPAMVLAASFISPERAQAALARWRAEGALPADARLRVLTSEARGAAEPPLLLFP
ncbi:hypothetical protein [Bosea sp. (in: a-proteobacteria)]|uniref:hypothetical protein n=1 Tax=Bosea sp. (in: a-proteobacteria) TaxID=1871050 RepID=UPI003B3AF824